MAFFVDWWLIQQLNKGGTQLPSSAHRVLRTLKHLDNYVELGGNREQNAS